MVDGREVAPEEGGEGKGEDGLWPRSLHHRLGSGARTQQEALPHERGRKRMDQGAVSKSNMLVPGTCDFVDYLLLMISVFLLGLRLMSERRVFPELALKYVGRLERILGT